jgi:hypothetical protein
MSIDNIGNTLADLRAFVQGEIALGNSTATNVQIDLTNLQKETAAICNEAKASFANVIDHMAASIDALVQSALERHDKHHIERNAALVAIIGGGGSTSQEKKKAA